MKIFSKEYWSNIREVLVDFNEKTGDLESLYGKSLVNINRFIDHPLTILDAGLTTVIVGSIFYGTTKELYWSYFVAAILSLAAHYLFRLSGSLTAISYAYDLTKKDISGNKGYSLMRKYFFVLMVALLAIFIVVAFKTDRVVKVAGKENLKIQSEEEVKAKFDSRRIEADTFYNNQIALINAKIIQFDTSSAYRNKNDQVLVYWRRQMELSQKNRAELITEKKEEIARIDKLENTALAVLRKQNNKVEDEFNEEFVISGKFANGANLSVTLIRILWQFIFAFFIRYAVKETEDLAAEVKEREELARQQQEAAAAERKRKHELAKQEQEAATAAKAKEAELAAFKREQENKKIEAENQAKLILAKAQADSLLKEKELELIKANKALEEKQAKIELQKLQKMKEIEEARAKHKIQQTDANNELRQQQQETANIPHIANNPNANMNANNSSYFAGRPLVPTSFVGKPDKSSANANKYMPTQTDANTMDSGVGIPTKPANTRQRQQEKSANINVKDAIKEMTITYQNGIPGVVVGGKWRNRRDVGNTLSANKGRAEKPDASQTVKDNVHLYTYAKMLIDAEKKRGE